MQDNVMRFSWNAKHKRTFQFCETKLGKQLFTFALFAKLNQGLAATLDDIDIERQAFVALTMVFRFFYKLYENANCGIFVITT